MQLQTLLQEISGYECTGSGNPEITGLTFDSRKVQPGFLYIAVCGTLTDGNSYIPQALEKGAVAVLTEKKPDIPAEGIEYIITNNAKHTAGLLAAAFYHHPEKELKMVGITGTNGKTSVVSILHEVFNKMGKKAAMLSTVQNKIGQEIFPSTHTTPDSISLYSFLRKAADAGCRFAFMEVSSHGIDQDRIAGISFAAAGFTNITRDHLDYHGDFATYRDTKKKLFDGLSSGAVAIVNADDKNAAYMLQNTAAEKKTYAVKTMADYHAQILHTDFSGMEIRIGAETLHTALTGIFNASNLLLVYALGCELGADEKELLRQLSTAGRVKGRFETYTSASGIYVIIDYAHTTDALQNILDSINEIRTKKQRLIAVAGCGGDRDRGKRPQMAKIAVENATLSIFTSDNPRNENPQAILDEMIAGVPENLKSRYTVEEDRKSAIALAVKFAEPGDVILIAGKGHETYQEIKNVRYPFDDAETVLNILTNAGK